MARTVPLLARSPTRPLGGRASVREATIPRGGARACLGRRLITARLASRSSCAALALDSSSDATSRPDSAAPRPRALESIVTPRSSSASSGAPHCSSSRTIATWPQSAARWTARLGSAPRSSSRRASRRRPCLTACCSRLHPAGPCGPSTSSGWKRSSSSTASKREPMPTAASSSAVWGSTQLPRGGWAGESVRCTRGRCTRGRRRTGLRAPRAAHALPRCHPRRAHAAHGRLAGPATVPPGRAGTGAAGARACAGAARVCACDAGRKAKACQRQVFRVHLHRKHQRIRAARIANCLPALVTAAAQVGQRTTALPLHRSILVARRVGVSVRMRCEGGGRVLP